MTKSDQTIETVNTALDVSAVEYEREPRYRSGGYSGERRSGSGGGDRQFEFGTFGGGRGGGGGSGGPAPQRPRPRPTRFSNPIHCPALRARSFSPYSPCSRAALHRFGAARFSRTYPASL